MVDAAVLWCTLPIAHIGKNLCLGLVGKVFNMYFGSIAGESFSLFVAYNVMYEIEFPSDEISKELTSTYEAATVSDGRAGLLDNAFRDNNNNGVELVQQQSPPIVACPPSLRPPMLTALQESSNPYLLSASQVDVAGEGIMSNRLPKESDQLLEK